MTFASLGLSEPILAAIRAANYENPTPIQEATIPAALAGHDMIALAETGSGKTAAFGLPILDRLLDGESGLRALILVPTRELCVQVAESLRDYSKGTDLGVCTAFGGVDMSIQESAFKRGLDVLVACPGRLIDHLERQNINLKKLEMLVLDEADRMLDMGFLPQIRSIMVRCPHERQTSLFSATMPAEVDELCNSFLPDAKRIQVGSRTQTPKSISHRFVGVDAGDKERVLEELLRREAGRVLVFVKTKIKAEKLGNKLRRDGFSADSIHGDKGAEARYVVLKSFDRGRTKIMVATDVAARGIDVDQVELVLNFDMPNEVEDYVHRSGRTGRAGATGRAISLVAPSERQIHRAIVAHLNGKPSTGGGSRSAGGGRPSRGRGGRLVGSGSRRR